MQSCLNYKVHFLIHKIILLNYKNIFLKQPFLLVVVSLERPLLLVVALERPYEQVVVALERPYEQIFFAKVCHIIYKILNLLKELQLLLNMKTFTL